MDEGREDATAEDEFRAPVTDRGPRSQREVDAILARLRQTRSR